MGGQSSRQSVHKKDINPLILKFLEGYEMVKNQKEPTLGDVKIFQKPNTEDFLVYKAIIFQTDEEARDFLADIKLARQLSHPNILELISTCCKNSESRLTSQTTK